MYVILISFFILGATSVVHGHDELDNCKSPYKRIGAGCYLISQEKALGDDAFALCWEKGGYLANFETLQEALKMKAHLKKTYSGTTFFVGGRNINRYVPGGDWRWIRYKHMFKMEYYAFMHGMPNGSLSDPQDCLAFWAASYYEFNDLPCNKHQYGYICEQFI